MSGTTTGQLQTLGRPENRSVERQVSARDWTFINGSFEPRSAPRPGQIWALVVGEGASLTFANGRVASSLLTSRLIHTPSEVVLGFVVRRGIVAEIALSESDQLTIAARFREHHRIAVR